MSQESSSQNLSQSRLSRIDTQWSLVRRAHSPDTPQVVQAQQQLLLKYGTAIRRYLGAALRDNEAADEVFQEFALKFVKGDFQNANPESGRFRSFVKTVLYRLIVDHHRRKKSFRREQGLPDDPQIQADPDAELAAAEEALLVSWREELLNSAWRLLEEYSQEKQAAFYVALRMRVERPELSSTEMAEQLSKLLGKDMTPGGTRILLHRARERFAESLLQVLEESVDSQDFDTLEEEIIELRLLDYCRDALESRRQKPD